MLQTRFQPSLILLALCLALTGCTARPTQKPAASTLLPSATPTTPPKAALATETAAMPAAAAIPADTSTPAPEPTLPVSWLVPARQLPDWPAEGFYRSLSWTDPHTLQVEDNFEDMSIIRYNLSRHLVTRSQEPVPLYHGANIADTNEIRYSPKRTYAVICADYSAAERENNRFHTMYLYRVKDDKLISQISEINTSCRFSIRWAPNESALTFVSERHTASSDLFPYDIYLWKVNGSKPFVISKGSYFDEPGAWSPDSTRLVVEMYNASYTSPDDEETYQILYPDGRPPQKTKGQLGVRAQPGLSWLTNSIVYEGNDCCVICSFTDYYVADTGEPLEELSQRDCGTTSSGTISTQRPHLSDNQRWFVVDQTRQDFLEPNQPFDFTYTLYDFQTRQAYALSQSDEIIIDFIGWDNDSTFYLVRRPINDNIAPQPDAPFGLLALDPLTRQMRLISGEIRYAWLSPDKTHFIGAARKGDTLFVSIYTLNGQPITDPLQRTMPEAYILPDVPKLQSIWEISGPPLSWAWSHDGRRVALLDGDLWLIDLEGQIHKLADNLSEPAHYFSFVNNSGLSNTSATFWSPEDDYLLIQSGTEAWAIDMAGQ